MSPATAWLHEPPVVLRELVEAGTTKVRVAEDREVLEAHRSGRELDVAPADWPRFTMVACGAAAWTAAAAGSPHSRSKT